jgi:biotin carboxyl carrier protein
MLRKVRKFIKNHSPDWLNTEVNKNLLQNLSAPLFNGGWEDLNQSQDEVKRSQTKSDTNNDRPLMTDDCLLMTVKGTPHWRRINQVFQSLDTAPENATYNQLIEYVKETTGKGCSRKLISKWKKHCQNSSLLPPTEDQNLIGDRSSTNTVSNYPAMAVSTASPVPYNQTIQPELSTVNSFQLNEPTDNFSNDDSLNRPTLLPVKAWTYLTAAGITIAIFGCELLPLQISNNRLTENVAIASVTAPLAPLPPIPETRKNRLEPSNIKIELTLSNPQDLKVKPGDKVSAGQTLSNRTSERNRLQAKKKQLQLSLEKLNLPLTPIPQPRPIPEIRPLLPVSYAEEEAEIKLKQQKLTEAENAIALAQKKIDFLNGSLMGETQGAFSVGSFPPKSRPPKIAPVRSLTQLHASLKSSEKGDPPQSPLLRGTEGDLKQGSRPNLKLILEHEQANLKNLETAKKEAQIQLEVQESKLTTARENRAYIEYQRQLEQTRRVIAVEQQHQAIQQTESERQILLAEREYSQAQIETQIQEIDYQTEQLSTVKAPYEGTIKKVKWTGQSDNTLTALVTLSVTSDRSTIANSRAKSFNSQQ